MTIDQWIAVASSAGTLTAAIIAAVNIYVIRNQNKNQRRPHITIADTMYEAVMKQNHNRWDKVRFAEGEENKKVRLPVLNVGNGIAAHIKVKWRYEETDFIEECNSALTNTNYYIKLKGDSLQFIRRGQDTGSIIGSLGNSETSIDYIAPVTVQPGGKGIWVDHTLQSLSLILVRETYTEGNEEIFSKLRKRIYLDISYLNNLGDSFEESIEINIRLLAILHNSGEDFKRAIFSLERISTE